MAFANSETVTLITVQGMVPKNAYDFTITYFFNRRFIRL